MPTLIVHGGAGVAPGSEDAARAACARAVAAGMEILRGGGSALDAVQIAVRVLEDDPELNAGIGAALTRDGTVELDASIMDGPTRRFGGVAAVPNLRQPIDLARAVLDDGEHVLLCGPAAWSFARERGIHPVDPSVLITEKSREKLAAWRRERGIGTVGACAVDAQGRSAAATSTGGTTGKRPGRVGDTPICGCGTYADDAGAASATGTGEMVIRTVLARFLVDKMRAGASPDDAAAAAIAELATLGGDGGIICVDRHGRFGHVRNTPAMPVAWATSDDPTRKTSL